MTQFARVLIVSLLLTLAACSSTSTMAPTTQVAIVAPPPLVSTLPATPTVAQTTTTAAQTTDVAPFIDTGALALLGANDRTSASSATFYALQFGRPGAPRAWQGGSGTSGQVSVGPYVRVNNLDCREFTHAVTIAGNAYTRKGTACRETDGRWTLAAS